VNRRSGRAFATAIRYGGMHPSASRVHPSAAARIIVIPEPPVIPLTEVEP